MREAGKPKGHGRERGSSRISAWFAAAAARRNARMPTKPGPAKGRFKIGSAKWVRAGTMASQKPAIRPLHRQYWSILSASAA